MVTFPDQIHPKYGLILRFKYKPRAFQYLDYFKITVSHGIYKFVPLDLTFDNYEELEQFLYNRGIVFNEIEISSFESYSDEITIVDTKKIYEVEESVVKYLLNYKYYSINEVAEMLSMSRPTIYKLVDDQILKAIRIHG